MTRSLSFTQNNPDDPFLIYTPSEKGGENSPTSGIAKRRRSTIASPAPLALKRKKNDAETVGSPVRRPMTLLRPNAPLQTYIENGFEAMNPAGASGMMKMIGGGFSTPIRPQRGFAAPGTIMAPGSVSRNGHMVSSPGDPGAAATLGLVPEWAMGTPGFSGIVGNDTPHLRQ
jgi:hypothetical protein